MIKYVFIKITNAKTNQTITKTKRIDALVVEETFPTIEPDNPTVTEPRFELSTTLVIGDETAMLGLFLLSFALFFAR